MRHRQSNRKLNRSTSHRLAMLRNLAKALLECETIRTTLPKAKELRRVVEPLITLGKRERTVANLRLAASRLGETDRISSQQQKQAKELEGEDRKLRRRLTRKLFDELGPRYRNRNGGYVRILKCGFRKNDNAPMALVELVDRPQARVPTPTPTE